MPQANIYFTKEEDEIIEEFSKKWDLSKHETVKRLIRKMKGGKKT